MTSEMHCACALIALLAAGSAEAEPIDRKWAALAVPLVAYDSSMGFGVGGYGQIVLADLDGDRPYRANLDLQLYKTTGGWDDHFIGWDLPGAFGGPVRWDARIRYQRWTEAPYYGLGNDARREDPDRVGPRWNRWQSVRPFVQTHVRVPLGPDSPWEAYAGGLWSWLSVTAFPNSLLTRDDPTGIDGGMVSVLTLGLFRDTRTDEVDPSDGTALDLAARIAAPEPLSDYAYGGVHLSGRGWWRATERLVVAGHLVADGNVGEVPFFEQAVFGGLTRTGIGGRYLLRGLAEERLRGHGLLGTQWELRARLGWVTLFRRLDVGFTVAPFVDAAQVLRWNAPLVLAPHPTTGAGLRVNINKLLVVRFDGAVGFERYVDAPRVRPQPQIYMLAAQPF